MKRIPVFILGVLASIFVAEAQMDPQFSHYMFNQMSVNPGYAGSSDKVSATMLYRNQWLGIDGAPATFSGNVNTPFRLFGGSHGIGFSITQDEWGFYSNLGMQLSYAFRFNMGDGKLGIGVGGGFYNSKVTGEFVSNVGYPKQVDVTSDRAIPQSGSYATVINFAAGAFYRYEDLSLGLSVTNLATSKDYSGTTTETSKAASLNLDPQCYLTAGYAVPFRNPAYEIRPSVNIKTDFASFQADLNLMLVYNKKVWGGVTIRANEACLLAGFEMNNGLRVGLAYDFNYSKLVNDTYGSLEVMFGYSFDLVKEKIPQKYKSAIYL